MPRKRRSTALVRRRPVRRRRVRRAARRVGRVARRAASRTVSFARQAAIDNQHTLIAAGVGALLGAVEDRVNLWKIPGAKKITPAGVLAIGLFGLSFVLKKGAVGRAIRHATTGCASIATYVLGKKYLGPKDQTVLGADLDDFLNSVDLDLNY